MLWFASADNRRSDSRLGQNPGDGELSDVDVMFLTKRFQLLHRLHLWLLPVARLVELASVLHGETRTFLGSLAGLIATGEQTACKRIIADDAYALIHRQREQLGFYLAE